MNCTADLGAAAGAAGGAPPPPRSSRCRDCGNQAKRDCQHSRCRTCCKGRGFHCLTHVKSTWVPVSRRRTRHLTTHFYSSSSAAAVGHQMGSNPKRHRETYSPNLGSEGNFDNFPAEMRFPAVFRCVRVRSADNAMDQYAYQTSVRIGGRVFAGILYDHGPEGGAGGCFTRESSSSGDGSGSLHLQQANNILITRGNAAVGTLPSSQLPICVGTPFLAFSNSTTPTTTTNYSNLFQFPKS